MPIIDFKAAMCKHCYKCVRGCEVKSIMIRNGHAYIMPNRCILCGQCLLNCPQSAKRVSGGLSKVKEFLKGGAPVGELQLKQIDREKRECTLSVHMQNDGVKGRGYGTQAERLALRYAFDVLDMAAVNADTVVKNTRSQHILEKLGFQHVGDEGDFRYYRCRRE